MDDLCQQAVQLGRSRLGFDRVGIWFIEEQLGIMRGSFGTDVDRAYVLAVVRDITRRKQIERSLREREVQLQHIVDTVPAGVLLLDADGRIYLMNPVAEKYLAVLAPDQEDGRLEDGRLLCLGEQPLQELLTSPPQGLWHEITSSGFVFEAIARPVENSAQSSGWVLVLRDITEERDIQQRVQRQERLAAVGQLAAGIAHDFNNILAVITWPKRPDALLPDLTLCRRR